jgi:cytochrome c-type biogenesis protein
LRTLFFILGFSFTFVILGVFAKYFSLFVFSNKKIFNFVIGLFLIFFGLHLLGFFRYIFSYRFTFFKKHSKIYSFLNFSNIEKRFDINKIGNKFQNLQKNNIGKLLWNFIFGVVFSFSWTPCVGPILGSILMLASAQESIKQSTHLLSIYSLGLALPFFTAVIFFDFLFSNFKKIFKYLNILQIFIGFVILFLGIFIINEKIL